MHGVTSIPARVWTPFRLVFTATMSQLDDTFSPLAQTVQSSLTEQAMKKIEATVAPAKARAVQRVLTEAGISRMTLSEVKEYGLREGHIETYRGTECLVDFARNIKIELVVRDDQADRVQELITGSAGDGKSGPEILIYSLDQAARLCLMEPNKVAA